MKDTDKQELRANQTIKTTWTYFRRRTTVPTNMNITLPESRSNLSPVYPLLKSFLKDKDEELSIF